MGCSVACKEASDQLSDGRKQHGEETYNVCGRSRFEGGCSKFLGASLPAIASELLIAPRSTLLLVSSSSTKGT